MVSGLVPRSSYSDLDAPESAYYKTKILAILVMRRAWDMERICCCNTRYEGRGPGSGIAPKYAKHASEVSAVHWYPTERNVRSSCTGRRSQP